MRICITGLHFRILLFSSVAFKMPTQLFFLLRFFCFLLFVGTFTSVFRDNKLSFLEATKLYKIKILFLGFCLLLEGNGSGSAQIITDLDPGGPKTYEIGCGSGPLENIKAHQYCIKLLSICRLAGPRQRSLSEDDWPTKLLAASAQDEDNLFHVNFGGRIMANCQPSQSFSLFIIG